MNKGRGLGLRLGLAAVFGAVGALGLAPYGLWPATLVSLAAVFVLFERAATARQALLTGWVFGTGFFGLALIWIVEPFFVEPEIYGWMAPFALVFMAAGLAIFWAAAFFLAFRAPRHRLLGLAVALGVAELLRAYVLSGFPWAGFAQIWVGVGPDLLLPVAGPHGLGLITIISGLALAQIFSGSATLAARLAGPLALSGLVVSGWLLQSSLSDPILSDHTVRLVQPNAPQDQKWDPAMIPVFLDRQMAFTAAADGPRPDLIVWPETSIPTLLEYADPILDEIAAAAGAVPVIAGIQRREGRRLYNAALLLEGGAPRQIYDKHHLVPFGEYIPLGNLAARFGLHGFATQEGQGFSAGPGPRLIDLGPLGRALPLICYEAVFPHYAKSPEGRADLLIQITNDAWFGEHSGPYQHLAQARMRALEQGLPMIRAANTGISAVIDPYGRIIAELPLGWAGFVDAALPKALSQTFYARTGDWLVSLIMILSIFVVFRRATPGAMAK